MTNASHFTDDKSQTLVKNEDNTINCKQVELPKSTERTKKINFFTEKTIQLNGSFYHVTTELSNHLFSIQLENLEVLN